MRKYFDAFKTFKPLLSRLESCGWFHPAVKSENEVKSCFEKGTRMIKLRKMTAFENFQHEIPNQIPLKKTFSAATIILG